MIMDQVSELAEESTARSTHDGVRAGGCSAGSDRPRATGGDRSPGRGGPHHYKRGHPRGHTPVPRSRLTQERGRARPNTSRVHRASIRARAAIRGRPPQSAKRSDLRFWSTAVHPSPSREISGR